MVLLVVSVLLALLYTAIFLNRFRHMRQFDGFTIVLGMYAVIYGILPALILVFKDVPGYEFIAQRLSFSKEGQAALLYYEFLSIIGFISLLIGYTGRYVTKSGLLSRYDIEAVQAQKNKKADGRHEDTDIICLTAWICLAIGVVSLYLWARAYGSVLNLIQVADRVRSGRGDVQNSLAFFKRPATLVMAGALIFFTLMIQEKGLTKRNKRKMLNLLGFFLSVTASWFYLFASDGRLGMVLFVFGFVWAFAFQNPIKHSIRALAITSFVLILGLIMLYYMDSITYYLRHGVWSGELTSSSVFQMIMSELMFIPISGQLAITSRADGLIGFTILDDLLTGICAWLPTPLKIPGFNDVWNINTELWRMRSAGFGQMPCNMISQGYYDLGALGVILLCFVFGKAVRKFQEILIHADMKDPFWVAISALVTMRFIYGVPYCSMYSFVLGLFGAAVAIVVYWFCKKLAAIKR